MIQISELTSGYGPTAVVHDFSLQIATGERLAILGRNGVGKSTLLKTIVGVTNVHKGSILLDKRALQSIPISVRARSGIGYVPQTRDVFPSLTVEQNLIAGLKGRNKKALSEAYELFPRLAERKNNMAFQLSGGEQQMLTIARTILGKPIILLLDEPLEGLAPVICDEVMKALSEFSKELTVVLVEQQIERALKFADRIVIMEKGSIAWAGETSENAITSMIDKHLGLEHVVAH